MSYIILLLLNDLAIEHLVFSLNSNDFLFDEEWFIQRAGTSMGRDWAPHYADIYIAKVEKEVLLKCPFKPRVCYRYLNYALIIWPHGTERFSAFLNIFNAHEPFTKFIFHLRISSSFSILV